MVFNDEQDYLVRWFREQEGSIELHKAFLFNENAVFLSLYCCFYFLFSDRALFHFYQS